MMKWTRSAAVAVVMTWTWAAGALAAGAPSPARPQAGPPDDYGQGVRAVQAGDYARAVTFLGRAVQSDPRNADAWNYLGFSYRNLRRFDEAMAAYQKALAIDPNHRGAHEYLGQLYLQMGQMGRARELLERLGRLCPAGCKERDDLRKAIAAREAGGAK